MAVVFPTYRPKSVLNQSNFLGRFLLSRCFLDFSVGVGAFAIGLSKIFSFISSYNLYGSMQVWQLVERVGQHGTLILSDT